MDDMIKPEAPRPESLQDADRSANPDSPEEEPTCAICGGRIGPDDVVCPHCGASLVAG